MKRILSIFLILAGIIAFTVSPSNAAALTGQSLYYIIPIWGDTPGATATPVMRTTISVTSYGDLTANPNFRSTGATVKIMLYNNAITKGTANNWASITVSGTGSLWGSLVKNFSVTGGLENFLADTQNVSGSTQWATSSGWANNTSNWGFGTLQITTTVSGALVDSSDFAIQGFFYGANSTALAGFPITIGVQSTPTATAVNGGATE